MCVFSLFLGPKVSAVLSVRAAKNFLGLIIHSQLLPPASGLEEHLGCSLPLPLELPLGLSSCSLPHISTLMLASLEVFCLLPKTINTTNFGVGGQKKHEERLVLLFQILLCCTSFGKICYSCLRLPFLTSRILLMCSFCIDWPFLLPPRLCIFRSTHSLGPHKPRK